MSSQNGDFWRTRNPPISRNPANRSRFLPELAGISAFSVSRLNRLGLLRSVYVLISFQFDGSEKTKSVFDTLDCCRVTGKVRFTVRLSQFMWSYPMNIFRLTAVAVSLTLFSACGGGGGGGGAAGGGGGGGGGGIALEPLPPFLINRVEATASVEGEDPRSMTSDQIESEIGSIAQETDSFLVDVFNSSDSRRLDVVCAERSCTVNFTFGGADRHRTVFSLDNFGNIPQVNSGNLTGFNEEYEVVMTHRGVTLAQLRNAGRFSSPSGDVILQYQSYGGWLEDSVFAFQAERLEGEDTAILLTSYSFGDRSGSRPSSQGSFRWSGVVIGTSTGAETRHVIHGDAEVVYTTTDANALDSIAFSNVKNLNNGQAVGSMDLEFQNVPLTENGSFELSNSAGDIEGVFYGDGHEEVGGIFHTDTYVGAFGATR